MATVVTLFAAFVAQDASAQVVESWSARLNGPANRDDTFFNLAVDPWGNVLATGRVTMPPDLTGISRRHVGTVKYAPDGAELWRVVSDFEATMSFPAGSDFGVSMSSETNGGCVIATETPVAHPRGTTNGDFIVVKYDAGGNELWRRTWDGPLSRGDTPADVAVDGLGNVYALGTSHGACPPTSCTSESLRRDIVVLKYDPDGTLLWETFYNGGYEDTARALALDGNGGLYVTGLSYAAGQGFNHVTLKYDTAMGVRLWASVYNGPGNQDDQPAALAVDPTTGGVMVTGFDSPAIGKRAYATVAYDADGTLRWVARSDSIAGYDMAAAVAVDPVTGWTFVTGRSFDEAGHYDYLTIAYDADGSEVWRARREESSTATTNGARALVIDKTGNVVVTGQALGPAGADFVTVTYAPGNGAVLWEKFYNGAGSNRDVAVAVAVGPDGGIVVGGTSIGVTDGYQSDDYAVVKYAYEVLCTDNDNDGYYAEGGSCGPQDCNDNDPKEYPNQIWYKDADHDRYSSGDMIVQCSRPAGYKIASELISTSGDCNDDNTLINPAATEVCDGIDNNCNGQIDEGLPLNTYYQDADSDSFGNPSQTIQTCFASLPSGYVTNSTDCDDNKVAVNPGAKEVCNGIDDNCNGSIDEGVYVFGGFKQPINSDGSSIFKAGSTIPVKITLTDCSGQSISTATVTIAVYKITDAVLGTVEELLPDSSGNANTGTFFRYDPLAGQYIYNLSTKGLTGGTYAVRANPDDGSSYSVNVSLK